ncbi:glycerate kinase [Clostridium paraputrificum]|uniref:glycerate kinase n=1 Tax=Clostridium paraputrificum TaxID=29363 RepID=UPI000D94DF60|nr:glycerate kinase [Clostridium paraputrificum]SQB91240.1 glycerate kinase [Clostridium paraputrificum]
MKFILAPDSFKESMTAKEACISMENGIRKVFKDATCIHVPMADGGEGTVDALIESTNGNLHEVEVTAPLGNKVKAKFGILGDGKTAVIEMAEASGIHLVKLEDRNPLLTTTFGTGELIKYALDMNIERIIIGLGGSATNDGGVGMLQALGASFKDSDGKEIAFGGGVLKDLCTIDLSGFDKRIYDVKIEVACDVKNPLTGENGASFVFGAQKGGNKETLEELDSNLKHYAEVVKRDMGKEIDKVEGAGAAGGLGAALIGFCNGKLESGIDLVIKHSNLEDKVRKADFVFTGEGSIDFQTKFGKTPIGVAKIAKKYNIPVIAFGGRIGEGIDELYSLGIDSVIGITPGVISLDEALSKGKDNLEISAENVVRILETRKV